jgi:integrase/recombinase XerC
MTVYDDSIEEFIDLFIEYLIEHKYSQTTITSYPKELFRFRDFLQEDALNMKKISKYTVMEYRMYCVSKGNKKSTIKSKMTVLRTFFTVCYREGWLSRDLSSQF